MPGPGFDTDATAAGIVPLVPKVGGRGPVLVVDGGQNNAYRAVNAAWKAGGTVRVDAHGRYEISGVAEGTLNQWVQSLALRADRAPSAARRAAAEAAHRPVPPVDRQHGRGVDALAARAVPASTSPASTTPTSAPAGSARATT